MVGVRIKFTLEEVFSWMKDMEISYGVAKVLYLELGICL